MLNPRSVFANIGAKAGQKAEKKAPDEQEDQDEAERLRKAKKAKKAEAEDDDEDDDEDSKKDKDDQDDAKASAARGRERARVRAILTSPEGLANPVVACHMALDTSMPRSAAIAAISSLNAATGVSAFDIDEGDAEASMATAILAAGAKARGEAAPVPPGRRERMGVRPEAQSARPPRDMVAAILEAGRKARGEA